MATNNADRRRPIYGTIAVLLLLVVVGLTAVYHVFLWTGQSTMTDLNTQYQEKQQQYRDLSSDTAPYRVVYVAAQNIDKLKKDTYIWSNMWQELNTLLPTEVSIQTLTAGRQGQVLANLLVPSLDKVAETITQLSSSTNFTGVMANGATVATSTEGGQSLVTPMAFVFGATGSGAGL